MRMRSCCIIEYRHHKQIMPDVTAKYCTTNEFHIDSYGSPHGQFADCLVDLIGLGTLVQSSSHNVAF